MPEPLPASERECAALVALLRRSGRPPAASAQVVERTGGAEAALRAELGGAGAQVSLLPDDPEPLIDRAAADIARWRAAGYRLSTILDPDFPVNLRGASDRPALIFVAGRLLASDARSISIIGSRRATAEGLRRSTHLSADLARAGYAVVSGLAAGIDTAAHRATLEVGGRTLAVIGTGLEHAYPPQNAGLQRQIADHAAVISPFWPEAPPDRAGFPIRNGVMAGLTSATVIVEASARSGTRIQARLALAHRRPVFLLRSLRDQQAWARELSEQPGVHVVDSAEEIDALLSQAAMRQRIPPTERAAPPTSSDPTGE